MVTIDAHAVERPVSMHHPPPTPSCCAGLRQTLMQGWQNAFPLHPSPFRQMAAVSGATPRELLSTCMALEREGALQTVRVRWGPAMKRERWRLAYDFDGPQASPTLPGALAQLPGCVRIERTNGSDNLPGEGAVSVPSLWAEFEVLDGPALQRQLATLPRQPRARVALPSPAGEHTVPCDDPRLAAFIEHGLKLCSRPFADCARHLDCSEQRVLGTLQAWRRTGQLECLTLRPPPARVAQPAALALWRDLHPDAGLIERLQSHHNVDRVVSGPGTPTWPWGLSVVLLTAPALALDRLRELRHAAGVDAAPDACLPLRIEVPRADAVLFSDFDPALHAAPTHH